MALPRWWLGAGPAPFLNGLVKEWRLPAGDVLPSASLPPDTSCIRTCPPASYRHACARQVGETAGHPAAQRRAATPQAVGPHASEPRLTDR